MGEHERDKVLPDAWRYVQPRLTEARLQRVWAKLEAGIPYRARVWRVWVWSTLAFGVCASMALVLVAPTWEGSPEVDSLLAGAVLETKSDSLSLALADGSALTLEQRSRVEVVSSSPDGVRLWLKQGRLECDVKPKQRASFVVMADGVKVRVVGTRFSVASERNAESRRVQVDVQRGEVEIHSSSQPAEVVRLKAGRSWSQVTQTGPAAPLVPEPARVRSSPEPSVPAPKRELPQAPAVGPRELLEEANRLRRAGNAREAAKHYETLLTKHGSDARAGLAAFELGRLRMDRFGDMKGAVSALEKAMTLAPGSGFREDALARVVTAHARSGNQAGCKRAKQRYLESYPRGVHRHAVLDQCGSR